MKTELWNKHKIRFVEVNGEWWAVAKDIADALDYAQTQNMIKLVPKKYLISSVLHGMNAKSILISEFGIYKAIFGSKKKEAEEFQEWVFEVIKQLRQSSGLEGYQAFRMLDKEHQKKTMSYMSQSLKHPVRIDFIKANVIANKAVSNMYGYPKMVKKADMTADMLVDRQRVLEDTTELMTVRDKFDLPISVSDEIYSRLVEKEHIT